MMSFDPVGHQINSTISTPKFGPIGFLIQPQVDPGPAIAGSGAAPLALPNFVLGRPCLHCAIHDTENILDNRTSPMTGLFHWNSKS
ncbi:hypothetical protein ASPCAL08881 [Aspergillus calidoustus]|uniref:Uncharacterized protein n=1 Tax=Aspergillus calidoustus TaxID=454130 RepID=A0A0U5GXU2_ASPCI|nr:hypothetical protein ASPCAL08881 [Aspergillus calidoustus]